MSDDQQSADEKAGDETPAEPKGGHDPQQGSAQESGQGQDQPEGQKTVGSTDDRANGTPGSDAEREPGEVSDEMLPEDLQPTEDNPLARHPGQTGNEDDLIGGGGDRERAENPSANMTYGSAGSSGSDDSEGSDGGSASGSRGGAGSGGGDDSEGSDGASASNSGGSASGGSGDSRDSDDEDDAGDDAE